MGCFSQPQAWVSVCLPHESRQMGGRAAASLPTSAPAPEREEAGKANTFPASCLMPILGPTLRQGPVLEGAPLWGREEEMRSCPQGASQYGGQERRRQGPRR